MQPRQQNLIASAHFKQMNVLPRKPVVSNEIYLIRQHQQGYFLRGDRYNNSFLTITIAREMTLDCIRSN